MGALTIYSTGKYIRSGTSKCKYCGELILWGKRNYKSYPFNAVRDENGNIKRDELRHIVVGGSHIATCKRDNQDENK